MFTGKDIMVSGQRDSTFERNQAGDLRANPFIAEVALVAGPRSNRSTPSGGDLGGRIVRACNSSDRIAWRSVCRAYFSHFETVVLVNASSLRLYTHWPTRRSSQSRISAHPGTLRRSAERSSLRRVCLTVKQNCRLAHLAWAHASTSLQ